MEHNVHLVDILDESGVIVGQKRRIDIIKPQDIYNTIHVILITPRGEIVTSLIPVREDLPNLYAQQIGTTVATIRRSDETADEAASRAVERELFIDHMPLTFLGERMYEMKTQRHNFMSTYFGISEAPESYSLIDVGSLIIMSPRELDEKIEKTPDAVAESLIAVWQEYRNKLPL